ncbi:inhibitor of growth protein 2 isoform X1 [Notechis scutatus]|uniref:Inhibitor of growth protein n=3 Tax=Hydrophiinae TaxID=292440 RepID=A0A6J1TX30_9SAUR|nr:inhibitor of growth protein 2 isoform X1 [Notechis scutatus]
MLGSPGQQPAGAGSGATAGAAAGSAATAAGGAGGIASFPCGGASERLLARYVQDYLECVESLPLDMQRLASLLREMDTRCREALKEIDEVYEKYKAEDDPAQKKRLQQYLQRALINSQELGDEKIQIVTQMLELVENRARQIESHSQCFQDLSDTEKPIEKSKQDLCQPERSSRRPRRQRTSESRDICHIANGIDEYDDQPPKEKRSKSAKKKKRSKAKQEREASPVEFAVDPNEPTYCLCDQVSYGEMIGCDNDLCPIEWFHFSCVGLTYKPKGKWYCPKCRGDNEKTMDKCTDKSKKDRRSRTWLYCGKARNEGIMSEVKCPNVKSHTSKLGRARTLLGRRFEIFKE